MADAVNIVWFKRDLRLRDHAPLQQALAGRNKLVCLYCFEPSVMALPEYSPRHWHFVAQCLTAMQAELANYGAGLTIVQAEVIPTLEAIARQHPIAGLFSHEETGLAHTYLRDQAVAEWCQTQAINWSEHQSNGVERGRNHREGWIEQWHAHMHAPTADVNLAELHGRTPALELKHQVAPEDLLSRFSRSAGRRALCLALLAQLPQRTPPGLPPGGLEAGARREK